MSENIIDKDIPITSLDIDIEVPDWIEQDITVEDVEHIIQGGCASGAYMPAVTYYKALKTMNDCGDDVLEYIENTLGEILMPREESSWAGLACHFVSLAVELWASQVSEEIKNASELNTETIHTDDNQTKGGSSDLIGYHEASKELNMPIGSLYSLVSRGKIPHYRLSKRCIRFSKAELKEWVKKHKVNPCNKE